MDFLKFLLAITSAFCIQLGKAEEMPLAYKQQEVVCITRVAVFCSADDKASLLFKEIATEVGKQLAVHNFGVITGGSRTGLMKEVVDGYVSTAVSSQHVYGVIPKVWQEYNVHHPAIPDTNLTWVDTLHIRMAQFHELADAIIVLPGGFGTLHELMDFMAHNQFAARKKRIILVNAAGYWDHLLALFNSMVEARLVPAIHVKSLCVVTSAAECIEKLEQTLGANQENTARYWEKTKQESK